VVAETRVSVDAAQAIADNSSQPAAAEDARGSLANSLGQTERNVLLDALRDGHCTRREIAERLGISPRTLRYKLARLRAAGVEVPAV
jgi:two-component system response regulator FlrC